VLPHVIILPVASCRILPREGSRGGAEPRCPLRKKIHKDRGKEGRGETGGLCPLSPTSVIGQRRWLKGEGAVLHTEDQSSSGLFTPRLETPLKSSDLAGPVVARITRLEFGEELASGLVWVGFNVLAHFRPVRFEGIATSAVGAREPRATVAQWSDDDSPCCGRSAPGLEKRVQSVELAGRIAPWIFRTELIQQLRCVEIWASIESSADVWPNPSKHNALS
jgi:hypothetical protein